MPQFRKKPIVIEAIRWEGATIGLTNGRASYPPAAGEILSGSALRLEMPAWMPSAAVANENDESPSVLPGSVVRQGDLLFIGTLEGAMRADPGDWIIRGVKGELYPCKPDIFEATYEPA